MRALEVADPISELSARPRRPCPPRRLALGLSVAGLLSLSVAVLSLLQLPLTAGDDEAAEKLGFRQVLVLDAGSSGTRIHIFNARLSPEAVVPVVDQSVRGRQTLKLKPGLSTFALQEDFAGAQSCIQKLLEFADSFVDHSLRGTTPVLVKATAGLRTVPADKAAAVLERVRQVLATSAYKSRSAWVSIIPGKEEGGLAWVAANYLAGTFRRSHAGAQSLGVIELGGGSAQVTFELQAPRQELAEEDSYSFTTLRGQQYRIYAHSYVGFGQDHAQARLREAILTELEQGGSQEAQDPCYPLGFRLPPRNASGGPLAAVGQGEAQVCIDEIWDHLFPSSSLVAPGRYPGEPKLKGRFVATENFFYIRNDLSLPLRGQQSEMEEAAKSTCLKMPESQEAEPKHCFALSYQAALLQALRRRPPPAAAGGVDAGAEAPASSDAATEDELAVEIVRLIEGGEVDWALGAAVVHIIQDTRVASTESTGFLPSGAAAGRADADGWLNARSLEDRFTVASGWDAGPAHAGILVLMASSSAVGLLLLTRRLRCRAGPCIEEKAV